jgi:uncharacterized lipoprotein YajG
VLKIIHSIFLALCFAGCLANVSDRSLRLSPLPRASGGGEIVADTPISIGSFQDSRRYSVVGEIDGRPLSATESVEQIVRFTLEQELRRRGGRIALSNAIDLRGEVVDWFVKVRPGFPTTSCEAKAGLNLKMFSPSGDLIFRGEYEGISQVTQPIFTKDLVEESLQNAMINTIEQVLEDDKFISTINNYYNGNNDGNTSYHQDNSSFENRDTIF